MVWEVKPKSAAVTVGLGGYFDSQIFMGTISIQCVYAGMPSDHIFTVATYAGYQKAHELFNETSVK